MIAYEQEDIIAAISTPSGSGGIGIVRLSGEGSIELADRLFSGKKKLTQKPSHTISYGKIMDGDKVIDEVLVSVMRAPHTYTCEDVVEINCHGGPYVTHKVLETVLKHGARAARAGEFTKRAFLNGRIDLTQAEAVIDLIQSPTEYAREMAVTQLGGRLKETVTALRSDVIDMIASLEAVIDYPEYDVEEETYEDILQKSETFLEKMKQLLAGADEGRILREGIKTVILGKPNVGKSSLLNFLLDEERAIVTDIPGTTRDTLEEMVNLSGIPMKLVDTAGIRETADQVEQIGVARSKAHAKEADLILLLLDASRPLEEEDREIFAFLEGKKAIVLLNKTDLPQVLTMEMVKEALPRNCTVLPVSILDGAGMEPFLAELKRLFFHGEIRPDQTMLQNTRQKEVLERAIAALERVKTSIGEKMPEDFLSMDLQEVSSILGEITGDAASEEIIDRIFTKFCLGK